MGLIADAQQVQILREDDNWGESEDQSQVPEIMTIDSSSLRGKARLSWQHVCKTAWHVQTNENGSICPVDLCDVLCVVFLVLTIILKLRQTCSNKYPKISNKCRALRTREIRSYCSRGNNISGSVVLSFTLLDQNQSARSCSALENLLQHCNISWVSYCTSLISYSNNTVVVCVCVRS